MRAHYTLLAIAACGAPPHPAAPPAPAPPPADARPARVRVEPPRTMPRKLLAIDWEHVQLATDADALALWQKIAPTGDDWEQKTDEIPDSLPVARWLAVALLREGNFACPAAPAPPCSKAPPEVPEPAPTATLADPCLRRLLALWALGELDDTDLPALHDSLRAIAALPPPESQLVAAAIRAWPESDHADRYDMIAAAWQAGQHDLVNGSLDTLDEPHLVAALGQLHAGGPLDILPAENFHAAFLGAIGDEQLAVDARITAMDELAQLAPKLPTDVHGALATAAKSADCRVAAHAARLLDSYGDHAFVPKLPRTRSPARMMRGLCVLVSYEKEQRTDEPSYFPTYLPARGLELVRISYDPYSDSDPDGDGDVHTTHDTQLVPPDEAVLPEVEELERAMRDCDHAVCRSDDHEFRFTFKPGAGGLLLARLEIAELPPCHQ